MKVSESVEVLELTQIACAPYAAELESKRLVLFAQRLELLLEHLYFGLVFALLEHQEAVHNLRDSPDSVRIFFGEKKESGVGFMRSRKREREKFRWFT